MKVPFFDLRAGEPPGLRVELDRAARRVMDSGRFVLGSEVAKFEKDFSAYCGTAHAVAVNTGTSALHLALLAAGVAPGDEVITVPLTFIATVSAIEYAGAKPVLVDVDPRTYTLDPGRLEDAISPRTRAIVPVHLYGQTADMEPILEIARRHGIRVVEDACQAHGATYRGRRAGSMGDLGCFSFYPSKNLGALGEGGAVLANDPEIARRLRMLRDWGQEAKYRHVEKGFNYRMDELQAAFLSVKLTHLDSWNDERRRAAGRYRLALAGAPFDPPYERSDSDHVYHVYAVRVPYRDALRERLRERGVETGIHYPDPVHRTPAFRNLGYSPGSFPVSEQVSREELSLPMFPGLTGAQIDHVVRALKEETLVPEGETVKTTSRGKV